MSSTTYTPPTPRQPYEDLAMVAGVEDDPLAAVSADDADIALAADDVLLDALTLDT
jgi:hypothetical protein